MMPYEVGKTFIIRVPLLSIETGLKLQVQREEFVDCVGEAMSVKNTEKAKSN